jgi:Ala-tRNA(Pro) deacylase
MKRTETDLYAFLETHGISWTRHTHPPLHTVEESRALRGEMPGGHCKNLFLKERKGGFWLAVCLEDREIRIKHLEKAVGARRLSFGNSDDLSDRLGVLPGAVTPFALINDPAGEVRLILDRQMLDHEILNYHPLHNEATIAMSSADLLRFFAATGHAPLIVDFDDLEARSRAG